MRTNLKEIKNNQAYKDYLDAKSKVIIAESELRLKAKEVVRKFCPYKKNMMIIYNQADGPGFNQHGIILKVEFNPGTGGNSGGVDGVWEITVLPTDAKFKPFFKDKKKMIKFLTSIDDKILKIKKL